LESGNLYYETAGRGHTLVLIHAAFLDSRMWDREFKLYSENYQVIRYDVRGFGKSDRPRDKFSDYKDLYSLLKHLGVGKACLLGISNGGRIALDFVSMHPEMVEALILVGTGVRGYQISGPDEEKEWNEFDARVMAKEEAKEKAIKEKRLKDAVTIEVDLWASAVSAELREPIFKIAMDNSDALVDPPGGRLQVSPQPPAFARLEEIKIPTLLIIGTKDVSGTMVTKRLSSIIPGSKMVLLQGADHIANMSKPREFDRTVLGFLNTEIRGPE